MIIDCHGHYTTAPGPLQDFRDAQIKALDDAPGIAAGWAVGKSQANLPRRKRQKHIPRGPEQHRIAGAGEDHAAGDGGAG